MRRRALERIAEKDKTENTAFLFEQYIRAMFAAFVRRIAREAPGAAPRLAMASARPLDEGSYPSRQPKRRGRRGEAPPDPNHNPIP
jgi:hypothetical protein